jgi:hypothetical protein
VNIFLYDNSRRENGEPFRKFLPKRVFHFVIKKECEYISFMTIPGGRIENLSESFSPKGFFILS